MYKCKLCVFINIKALVPPSALRNNYNYYMAYSHNHCIYSYTAYTNPLASGQRKRSLPSGVEVPKNDATVQGMMRQQN